MMLAAGLTGLPVLAPSTANAVVAMNHCEPVRRSRPRHRSAGHPARAGRGEAGPGPGTASTVRRSLVAPRGWRPVVVAAVLPALVLLGLTSAAGAVTGGGGGLLGAGVNETHTGGSTGLAVSRVGVVSSPVSNILRSRHESARSAAGNVRALVGPGWDTHGDPSAARAVHGPGVRVQFQPERVRYTSGSGGLSYDHTRRSTS